MLDEMKKMTHFNIGTTTTFDTFSFFTLTKTIGLGVRHAFDQLQYSDGVCVICDTDAFGRGIIGVVQANLGSTVTVLFELT